MSISSILNALARLIFPARTKTIAVLESLSPEEMLARFTPATFATANTVSLWSYRDPEVRLLVKEIKYHGNRLLAATVGALLFERIMDELGEENISTDRETYLLCPIPISRRRRRERGYNQAELIARQVALADSARIFKYQPNLLKKVRDTESQTSLRRRSDRLKNPLGCFAISGIQSLAGCRIILIDDVLTTGATLREARRVLKNAGARKVYCFTVAH